MLIICKRCKKEFEGKSRMNYCPECTNHEETCKVCGKKFITGRAQQVKCPDCVGKAPPKPSRAGEVKCAICGTIFMAKNAQIAKYCEECRNLTHHQKKKLGVPDTVSDNQKMVKVRCAYCEKVFECTWKEYRRGRKYCGVDCRDNARRRRTAEKYAPTPVEEKLEQVAELAYQPLPWQWQVWQSQARFKVLNCGNRAGKDRHCINEGIVKHFAMCSENRDETLVPKVMGWLVAPTYKMARQLWRELKYFTPEQWIVKKNEAELQFETLQDGLIEVKSADDPDSLVAVGLDWVIITEAARVKRMDEVWANVMARLASPKRGPGGKGGIALINSTPLGMNEFHKMYMWGQDTTMPQWASWTFPTSANPFITKEEIEMARRLLPDRLFRQNYLAEFLSDGGEVFANIDDISKGQEQEPVFGSGNVMAWDPSQRHDNSIFGIRNSKGEQIYLGPNLTGQLWEDQIRRIKVQYDRYQCIKIVIDKTGIGDTLPELARKEGMNVEEVYWAGGGTIKQDMVAHFIVLTEQKSVCLINHEMQKNELKAYTYKYNPKTGRTSYGAPSGLNDDHVSMLIMLYKDFNSISNIIFAPLFMGGIKKNYAI